MAIVHMDKVNAHNKIKRGVGEQIFDVANIICLLVLAATCLFPFIHLIARSFSAEPAINAGTVLFWPVRPHTMAYKAVFTSASITNAFIFTVQLTILGTFTNLLMTMLAAYPLSKPNLVFHKTFWMIIVFTMYFSGGLIPMYLLISNLNLLDNIWALILPGAVSTYHMIIMMTYFKGIPESLEESARLDGCTDIGVLFRIMLPLSLPVIAALALMFAVGHWNQYFSPMMYMTSPEKFTLQVRLRQLIPTDATTLGMEGNILTELPNESYKAAAILVSTVPILVLYPFLQKYFIKGLMLGSVKA